MIRTAAGVFVCLCLASACGSRTSPSQSAADGGSEGSADAGPPVVTPTSMLVHSDTTLYVVDDQEFALAEIGPFGLADDSITDLAVTNDGAVFAISGGYVYQIDPSTGAATLTTAFDGGHNVGMTFLNSGELLVADKAGQVRAVDPDSGQVSSLGTFGGNWGAAGDLVAIADGTMFAIVEDQDAEQGDSNVLATINPTTGALDQVIGEIGYSEVFGCAFANGKVYAFTRSGDIIEVDPATGSGTLVKSYPDITFWGAGVSPIVDVE